MAKQNHKKGRTPGIKPFELLPFNNPKTPYIFLGLIAFAFYINTIYNEFALDDGIVIHKNEYVMEGISGIDSILSRDAYHSFYKQMNASAQLAGGRYRPLSIVSFAIEQEFIGSYKDGKLPPANCWDKNQNGKQDSSEDINGDGLWNDNDCLTEGCMLRHFNNVLFYVLCVLLIYALLRNHMFPQYPDLAFLSALLFCIHPLHTEVIANMKSRDEIFSMIFISLTLISVFKFIEHQQRKYIIWTAIFYFLALLSKEYAMTLIFVIPLTLYLFDGDFEIKPTKAAIFFIALGIYSVIAAKFSTTNPTGVLFLATVGLTAFALLVKFGKYTWLFYGLSMSLMVYFCIRFSIVALKKPVPDTELLNNPFLLAKGTQVIATKIYVWLKYLILLFNPSVLSADYSYNSIPYRNLESPEVLLSLIIYISLAILTLFLMRKKHPAAWGLLFFFANFLMICNLLFDIGATMGERLIFHSSLGWAVCIAWIFTQPAKNLFKSVNIHRIVLLTVSGVVVVLFGYRTITRNMDWKNDITLFTHDVKTMPNSVLCLGNAGARWIDLSERPQNKAQEKEYLDKAITYLNHALELHPKYVNGYLNLGLAYLKLRDYNKAEEIWYCHAFQLYPSNPFLGTYFRVLSNVYVQQAFADARANNIANAAYWFQRAAKVFPQDPEIWYNLGGAAFSLKDFSRSKFAFEQCLKFNPNHVQAKNGLANIPAGVVSPVALEDMFKCGQQHTNIKCIQMLPTQMENSNFK